MLSFNIPVTLYTLNELSENARNHAIEEHRRFMLEILDPTDFISGEPEYDTPGKLNAAYESEYDYILMNDEPVTESIEINEYLYFPSGELANTVTYCNGHSTHPGETWLSYHGNNYRIA